MMLKQVKVGDEVQSKPNERPPASPSSKCRKESRESFSFFTVSSVCLVKLLVSAH